ncbi:MAG: hypothetical protein HQK87_09285 [Nitrospinae bacterium]|nr:hypothetical protein [Nitrospinota bacterium]
MPPTDLDAIAAHLRETLPKLRATLAAIDPQALRQVGPAGLSPIAMVAGLYRLESRLIRPALTVMLDADMPRLPGFALAERAGKEGYGAYDLAKTLRSWGEFRTGSVVLVESLDADALTRPGSIGGKLFTIGQLLEWWVAEEEAWMGRIGG